MGTQKDINRTPKNIKSGDRSHLFAKFKTIFVGSDLEENDLEINLQQASDKKYLKLYKIDTNLVNYETNTLENTIDFNHYNDDKNLSLGLHAEYLEL